MLYPENIEQKLGFDKIREMLKMECVSILGQNFVDKIQFSNQYDIIDKFTKQTEEFCQIIVQNEGFPQQNFIDVYDALTKALPENSFLLEQDFFDLKLSLSTINDCIKFFKKRPEQYPILRNLLKDLIFESDLIDKIQLVIDDRGKIRDNASFELRRIRTALSNAQTQLRKRLESILKSAKSQGFIQDDANLTLRDGRLVLPVQAEHKRKIKGFVHDESATGQTVYLEPAEIIDMNNEIRELEYAERREIIKILTELTNALRPHIPALKKAYHFLGTIDFIRAKAKFALKINAINPIFEKKAFLKWFKAFHPLLWLRLKEQNKNVQPLNITLENDNRILLISGPNAGGKSIALKTVGLIQYMYQSGLLVPVAEGSKMGIFNDIFIDLGDEQSLENDLSTYSSHLKNMLHFTKFSDAKSLLLIDEFGTGTEPQVGGAIAQAILEKLNNAKSFGVITTHYANLKFFAEKTTGIINGAMQFDNQNLEPLYRLEMGKPGSSYAFEIAQKIGLPKELIQNGKKYAGIEQVSVDKLLRDLELEKNHFQNQNQRLEEKEKQLNNLTAEYDKLKNFLETEKKRILNQAKAEAQLLVKSAKTRIDNTIKEIKESQAEQQKVQNVRKNLQEFAETVKPEAGFIIAQSVEDEGVEVLEGEIKVGNFVRMIGQTAVGEVTSIKGKNVEINFNGLQSQVKLDKLEKVNKKALKDQKKEIQRTFGAFDYLEKSMNFNPKIDIRGKRAEEVILLLGEFLDDAMLTSNKELTIVHGKGDGILRQIVRDTLRKRSEVQAMKNEHADRGGDGVTIVALK